jgi:hypothetical protein
VPVYWLNRGVLSHQIFNIAYSEAVAAKHNTVSPYGFSGLIFYARLMFEFGLLPVYSFFSALGLLLIIRRKVSEKGVFFFWIFGSYIILISTQTRCFEYAMPMIIPLAILASYAANTIFKNRIFRISFICICVFWGIVQFWFYAFPVAGLPQWCYRQPLLMHDSCRNYHPIDQQWRLRDIVEYIVANKDDPQGGARVHVGANLGAFSAVTLEYAAAAKRGDLDFCGHLIKPREAAGCDFVVVKSGQEQGVFYSFGDVEILLEALSESGQFVKLPKTFDLPDGSCAQVYKRRN